MLRSLLYAHFAESLSGLPTIRSYGEINRFLADNEFYIDLEDRASFLVSTNQRWLAIRLDFLGACMVFVVRQLSTSLSQRCQHVRPGRHPRRFERFWNRPCSNWFGPHIYMWVLSHSCLMLCVDMSN